VELIHGLDFILVPIGAFALERAGVHTRKYHWTILAIVLCTWLCTWLCKIPLHAPVNFVDRWMLRYRFADDTRPALLTTFISNALVYSSQENFKQLLMGAK